MLHSTDDHELRQEAGRLIADAIERQIAEPALSDGGLLWQMRDCSLLAAVNALHQAEAQLEELRERHPDNAGLHALALRLGNAKREVVAVKFRLPRGEAV